MNELVHIGAQDVGQLAMNNPFGLGDVDLSGGIDAVVSLKPTSINLVQPTTRDMKNAKPGQFLDTLSGAGYDKIRGVLMHVRKSRNFYAPGADLDTPAVCFSTDGITPHPDARIRQASACAKCKQGRWVGKAKPSCPERLNVLLAMVTDELEGLPRILRVSGVSMSPVRHLLETIQTDCFQRRKKGEQPAGFEYVFDIASVKKQGSKGSYYQMVPAPPQRVKAADIAKYAEFYKAFVLEYNALDADAGEDADVEDLPQAEVVAAEVVTDV